MVKETNITHKIIIFLFNFLLISVPLYFRFVNEELFEFNKMILVYTFTILIGFFWFMRMIQQKRAIIKKSPLDIPIILFVTSQFVSTIFSIHPRTSWLGYYSRFNGGLLSTISYIFLYYAFISNVKKKDLIGIFIAIFTSGILVSIYGILEHFGHSISCLFSPGIKDFSASCWKQDVQSRVFATFGQPNWLAAYAITILPLGFSLAVQNKNINLPQKLWQKIFFGTATILLFLALIFTKSRSGFLGFGVGAFVLFVGFLNIVFFNTKGNENKDNKLNKKTVKTKRNTKNTEKTSKIINLRITTIIIVTLLITAAIFGTTLTPSITALISKNKQAQINKIDQLKNDNEINFKNVVKSPQPAANRLTIGGTDSGEIRKIVWEGGLKIWQRYPIIGSGVETFAYSYYLDRTRAHNDVSEWDFLYNKAHNELINILANSGIFGLSTYLLIFAVFGFRILKTVFSDKPEFTKLISVAILAGIIGLSVSNFFGFSTVMVNVLMFVLFGIFVVIDKEDHDLKTLKKTKKLNHKTINLKIKNKIKIKKHPNSSINSGEQYFAVTILVIFVLILLLKTYNYWDADRLYANGKAQFSSGNYNLGIQQQIKSIEKSPKEALFYDSLSDNYAKLSIELAKTGQSTAAATILNEAIRASNLAMEYNDRHLNFYKTRSRVFVTLAQLNEEYLAEAQNTLSKAMELSPTDPKLVYTQAVIELSNGNKEIGQQLLEKAIILKPGYEKARWKLSDIYEKNGQIDKAIEQLEYILYFISPNNEKAVAKIIELENK